MYDSGAVSYTHLSDGNTAQDVLNQVNEDGADFEAIAREYSEAVSYTHLNKLKNC